MSFGAGALVKKAGKPCSRGVAGSREWRFFRSSVWRFSNRRPRPYRASGVDCESGFQARPFDRAINGGTTNGEQFGEFIHGVLAGGVQFDQVRFLPE